MLQISEIVRKTEEMFDLFNEHFYEGELNHPAITVSPDGGRGAYGWCSLNEIWNASGEKYREINLCVEYLDRPNLIGAGNRFQFIDNHYHGTGLLPREYRKLIKSIPPLRGVA